MRGRATRVSSLRSTAGTRRAAAAHGLLPSEAYAEAAPSARAGVCAQKVWEKNGSGVQRMASPAAAGSPNPFRFRRETPTAAASAAPSTGTANRPGKNRPPADGSQLRRGRSGVYWAYSLPSLTNP